MPLLAIKIKRIVLILICSRPAAGTSQANPTTTKSQKPNRHPAWARTVSHRLYINKKQNQNTQSRAQAHISQTTGATPSPYKTDPSTILEQRGGVGTRGKSCQLQRNIPQFHATFHTSIAFPAPNRLPFDWRDSERHCIHTRSAIEELLRKRRHIR